jgi:hypothetical protein
MRIAKQHRATTLGLFGLILLVAVSPRPATAQCGMMGSGGHDHGAAQDPDDKQSASEKKQRENVSRLLSDEQGRRVLAEALLEDREFTSGFLAHLLAIPEWRTFVSQQVAKPLPAPGAAGGQPAAVYTCPMHPDVTSAKPGACPKCGMALARTASGRPR